MNDEKDVIFITEEQYTDMMNRNLIKDDGTYNGMEVVVQQPPADDIPEEKHYVPLSRWHWRNIIGYALLIPLAIIHFACILTTVPGMFFLLISTTLHNLVLKYVMKRPVMPSLIEFFGWIPNQVKNER